MNNNIKDNENKIKTLPWLGIPKLLPYVRPYKKIIVQMVTLGMLSSLADSAYPLFNQYAINNFIGQGTLKGLPVFIALYVIVLTLQTIDNYITVAMCGKVEMSVNRDLRNASFSHLQELSLFYFNTNNVGYIHARVMSDSGKIGEMIAWRFMDIVWQLSYIIFVLIMMLTINLKLALIIFMLIPIVVILVAVFQKKLLVINRKIREINSKITGNFNEGITGASSIKTLVVEDKIQEDFEKDTVKMRSTAVRSVRYSAFFTAIVTLVSSLALAIVLWYGGSLSVEGLMTIGTISVFASYALGIMEPIQNIVVTISEIIAIQVNIERFTRLMETESDVSDRPDVIEKYGDTFNPKKENWEELKGDIEFKDITFRYPDGEENVLENFNLKVPQGKRVAIVGETGAGKSTLVNLVCRFYKPTKGQILIDGHDAADRSIGWLHNSIGYVLQTPHLFSGSVRENLKYGKEDATDEEIWTALDLVAAGDVVRRMEKGLDSDVGEGGNLLSTGEKQLLSFARAILSDPRILILDEATASIDTVTEKKIQNAIKVMTKGRTTFAIAHRLSTITDYDVILVVDDGRIVESGTHEELMIAGGRYFELFTRQFNDLVVNKSIEKALAH
ncbi:ABC transporter ATP-binding protein [Butyrivibrio sp. TB]|jgi:ATP-binding cassette subfamily B protein|uniref:ABC transporter ATP-binding protein n=1 Tax=Butyrivibrio sp. TB TaxID=1520809 RepID=UPI0008C507C9|nr:ABC transporter ATP-binding protein [Butyrivibrio sp. TB]SEQ57935.1 ATP-binding cassette, subfamily B [Butyrivibrio sp. TB]